jgi:hypothetical protein
MIRRLALTAALSSVPLVSLAPAPADAQAVPAALSPEEALKARWQRLVREADERIRDAEHAVESAKKTLDVAANQVVLMTTGHTMAARAAAVEALKKAEAEVEVARKAKVDLLERARLENVPPGYLR